MGCCQSSDEGVNNNNNNNNNSNANTSSGAQQPKNEQKDGVSTTGVSVKLEVSNEEFIAFIDVVKVVLITMLKRLTTTLGKEYSAFNELAAKTQKSNYVDFIDMEKFELFFRRAYQLNNEFPEPEDIDTKSIHYRQRKFECFLDEVEDSDYRMPLWGGSEPARQETFGLLQNAAKHTVISLENATRFCDRDTSSTSRIKNLKPHLLFFARTFRVFEGDIQRNINIFYDNIDKCCAEPI